MWTGIFSGSEPSKFRASKVLGHYERGLLSPASLESLDSLESLENGRILLYFPVWGVL